MPLQSHRIPGDCQRTCVIDPVLALSECGIPLIQQLGKRLELWVVRELWNILDSPTFYLNQPELITPRGLASERSPKQERHALETTLSSLEAWAAFRSETDLSGLQLFWLGDSPKESLLPSHRNLELFYRWEAIATSLDCPLELLRIRSSILPLAFRDTIALTISLGAAFILSYQSSTDFEQHLPPEICRTMEVWGMTCQPLPSDDAVVARERETLHQLLISTGLAKYLWAGTNLIVLHLIEPPGSKQLRQPVPAYQDVPTGVDQLAKAPPLTRELWNKTRGFWYSL
ncbi:MAG: hypothetical protein B0A82_26705 [Alkalinema sp. CACIAM 70d]|nr:MAG: hypothetical protein B0A82_26705 [Alkalinema sp. CACIAM 70d]